MISGANMRKEEGLEVRAYILCSNYCTTSLLDNPSFTIPTKEKGISSKHVTITIEHMDTTD